MEARAAAAPTYVRRESAPRRAWAWLKKRALNIYAGFAIAYLLIPIAVIIAFSFNNPAGKYNFTWEGFTLKHWADVFSLPDLNSGAGVVDNRPELGGSQLIDGQSNWHVGLCKERSQFVKRL